MPVLAPDRAQTAGRRGTGRDGAPEAHTSAAAASARVDANEPTPQRMPRTRGRDGVVGAGAGTGVARVAPRETSACHTSVVCRVGPRQCAGRDGRSGVRMGRASEPHELTEDMEARDGSDTTPPDRPSLSPRSLECVAMGLVTTRVKRPSPRMRLDTFATAANPGATTVCGIADDVV